MPGLNLVPSGDPGPGSEKGPGVGCAGLPRAWGHPEPGLHLLILGPGQ